MKLNLKMSLSLNELSSYLAKQLNTFFPDSKKVSSELLYPDLFNALERLEYCFSHFRRKNYNDGQYPTFDHLHTDQYAMFLYFLSNTIYRERKDLNNANKVYYLNKILHGIDVYYEVELPDIFIFRHCLGTVLGRAKYSDYFSVGQNCTVGNNKDYYPEFQRKVAMYNGSMIVGKCTIGTNSHISAKTFIRDQNVPKGSVAFGHSPNLVFKIASQSVVDVFFHRY